MPSEPVPTLSETVPAAFPAIGSNWEGRGWLPGGLKIFLAPGEGEKIWWGNFYKSSPTIAPVKVFWLIS